MAALTTLAPVLFMIGLGFVSRVKNILSPDQKEGANKLVFTLLFPLLVFSLLASAQIERSVLGIVLFLLAAYSVIFIACRRWLVKFFQPYEKIAPYLLVTAEGGNLALPLYVSIVGPSGNTVLLDIAGMLFCFCVIPVLVAKDAAAKENTKELALSILKNPFVLAAVFGILFNISGGYHLLESSGWFELYSKVIDMATKGIVPILLFIVGYNLNFSPSILKPALRIAGVRLLFYVLIILAFFVLFPGQMADTAFMMAVFLYFTCPTGFGVVMQLTPLYKDENDEALASGVISLNMIVTLLVYTAIVLWQVH